MTPTAPQATGDNGIAREAFADFEDAHTLFRRGEALAAVGRHDAAAAVYARAIVLRGDFAEAYYNLGAVLRALHQPENALTVYRQAAVLRPDIGDYHNALGTTALMLGRPEEAVQAFRGAIAAQPADIDGHHNLGNALFVIGRMDEAAAAYRAAIAAAPQLPRSYNNLGTVLAKLNRWAEAASVYQDIVRLQSDFPGSYHNLGNALLMTGRAREAVNAFTSALALSESVDTTLNLAKALVHLDRLQEALAAYRQALVLRPADAAIHNTISLLLLDLEQPDAALASATEALLVDPRRTESYTILGKVLAASGRRQEAEATYRGALARWPQDANLMTELANLLVTARGCADEEALALYRGALHKRPSVLCRARKHVPDFSVLLFSAPGAANTPHEYLLGAADYDRHFLTLLPGLEYDEAGLRTACDVVFNLVCDEDTGAAYLHQAGLLADRLGLPVLNHPRRILGTSRERVAERLLGIPGCRVPRVLRLSPDTLTSTRVRQTLSAVVFPVLVRPAGTHGGDHFEKLDNADAVAGFVAQHPGTAYYISEYIPYQSDDGYFRKYRLIFVNGEVLPYHLAIDDQWKVHHFRTDMAHKDWMRNEEETFLSEPASVFGAPQLEALRRMREVLALDYGGVDCALDSSGNIVVFEANATMLVHGDRGLFAYKQPYVERIKKAFDAMLAKAAARMH